MSSILVVDDEVKITRLLSEWIAADGYKVDTCTSAEEALDLLKVREYDIVLCDLKLEGMDGIELLRKTKKISPGTDFVIMTAYASASTAVEAMREGAYEYLIKPFQIDEVLLLLRRILERRDLISENLALREKISGSAGLQGKIIGDSPAIETIREMIVKVAPTTSPVLVLGESGTGKELVAAEIHTKSGRAKNPFIIINCAAVPETLLEAELFGYEKGAFTGASGKKPGQFKLADNGTLFLDEIGELSSSLQAKLLRAIENGEFLPLGGSKPVLVDVRIIAATNKDLETHVRDGLFREDLFYRLNVFPILIPPLRERKEDIAPLARNFLGSRRTVPDTLPADVMQKLGAYSWPGNVRELRNILERALILAGGEPIGTKHITIADDSTPGTTADRLKSLIGERTLPEIEKKLVQLALEQARGNKSRAAKLLGITRRTLYSRLERFGLMPKGEKKDNDP